VADCCELGHGRSVSVMKRPVPYNFREFVE